MIFRDEDHFHERLNYWVGVLRLRDWEINAFYVKRGDLGEARWAECTVWAALKEATLKVARVAHDHDEVPHDQEQSLVHELLHIPFQPFRPDSEKDPTMYDLWEQAVNTLARSYVSLDRAKLAPVATSGYIQIADVPHAPTNGHAKPELASVVLNG